MAGNASQWAQRLAPRHAVTVITRRLPGSRPARERRDGFELRALPVGRWPLLRTLADLDAIERQVASLSPRPQLLLCFQTFVSGYAGVRLQRRLGIPAVVWVRGEDEIRLARSWRARWTSPVTWRSARAVVVQSRELGEALLRELASEPTSEAAVRARLEVIPNGIELPPLAAPPARGRHVLAVGRLIPHKGMDVVIDAVAALGGQLTIAGDGPERAALEARARRLDLDVRFEGAVPRGRVAELYREAACVVLASRFGEGFPNVLLEAMAHACPVIATDVLGVDELVRDGESGLRVAPGDVAALRSALARLRDEPGLAERLGSAARRVAERYSWDAVVPQLESRLAAWCDA